MSLEEVDGDFFGLSVMKSGRLVQIRAAQQEIREKLKPETVEYLKQRAMSKRVKGSSASAVPVLPATAERVRFGLDGSVVGWMTEEEFRAEPDVELRVLRRDPLREDEGSVTPLGAYTLPEAAVLVKSVVQAQRRAGLQLIRNVLTQARAPLLRSTPPIRCLQFPAAVRDVPEVSWNEIWDFAVNELDVVTLLRRSLKDSSLSVVFQSVAALEVMCGRSEEEMELYEAKWMCPLTAWPLTPRVPLKRASASSQWEAAVIENAKGLYPALHKQLASGLLADFEAVVSDQMLLSLLRILEGLAGWGEAFAQKISNETRLMQKLEESVKQGRSLQCKVTFLELISTLMEMQPTAFESQTRRPEFFNVCHDDLCQLLMRPAEHESREDECASAKAYFRFVRIWIVQGYAPDSMDSISLATICLEPALSMSPPRSMAESEVISEIFLCLSTMLDNDRGHLRHSFLDTYPMLHLRRVAVESMRSVEAFVLAMRQEADIDLKWLNCIAAVMLFFSHLSKPHDSSLPHRELHAMCDIGFRFMSFDWISPFNNTHLKKSERSVLINFNSCLLKFMHEDWAIRHRDFLQRCQPFVRSCLKVSWKDRRTAEGKDDLNRTELVEIGDVLLMRDACHWASFSLSLVKIGSSLKLDKETRRDLIRFGMDALTEMPPGYDTHAISGIMRIISRDLMGDVYDEVPRVLSGLNTPLATHPRDEKALAALTRYRLEGTFEPLRHGFLATWLDAVPEEKLHELIEPDAMRRGFEAWQSPHTKTSVVHGAEAVESFLPLHPNFLFLPLRSHPSWSLPVQGPRSMEEMENDHNLIEAQLMLLAYLELDPVPCRCFSKISSGSKIKRVIQLVQSMPWRHYGRHDPWDRLLTRACLVFLVERFLREDASQATFHEWDASFVEHILMLLMSTRNIVMASIVALLLVDGMPLPQKLQMWNTLRENHLLHIFPPRLFWIGDPSLYEARHPPAALVEVVKDTFESGELEKAERMGPSLFNWAMKVLQ